MSIGKLLLLGFGAVLVLRLLEDQPAPAAALPASGDSPAASSPGAVTATSTTAAAGGAAANSPAPSGAGTGSNVVNFPKAKATVPLPGLNSSQVLLSNRSDL